MGTSERRRAIMQMLCRRRSEIIENIAAEFGVSERTIRRDIEALSLTEPIYTKPGRYGGGVYVMDGYYMDKFYFSGTQATILKKLLMCAQNKVVCAMPDEEVAMLRDFVSEHTAQ